MASTSCRCGHVDDAGDVQVAANRLAGLADQVGLVGLEAGAGRSDLRASKWPRCGCPARGPTETRGWRSRRGWRPAACEWASWLLFLAHDFAGLESTGLTGFRRTGIPSRAAGKSARFEYAKSGPQGHRPQRASFTRPTRFVLVAAGQGGARQRYQGGAFSPVDRCVFGIFSSCEFWFASRRRLGDVAPAAAADSNSAWAGFSSLSKRCPISVRDPIKGRTSITTLSRPMTF